MVKRRRMISKGHSKLSVVNQCSLLNLNRSGVYYIPQTESLLNLELMHLMDEHYLVHPEKGAPQMHNWLKLDQGYTTINNHPLVFLVRIIYPLVRFRS